MQSLIYASKTAMPRKNCFANLSELAIAFQNSQIEDGFGDTQGTRELIVNPYILVYKVVEEENQVRILRLWHAAQDR